MSAKRQVSVVIGVHNPGTCIQETLDSVMRQENVDLELVVVDDGSTDGSKTVLADLAAADPRIRILTQPHRGLTAALVHGCHQAQGEYIARQDAGDLSVTGRLAAQKAALDRHPEVGFVSCWTEFCGPRFEFLHLAKARCPEPVCILDRDRPGVLVTGPTCHPSVMFRKLAYDRVGGYRPAFYYSQDWDLWYRLAEVGSFMSVEKCLYRVRVLPSGLSADKRLQERYARLARLALVARQAGRSDADVLEAARGLAPELSRMSSLHREASIYHYLGASLARNGDPRAAGYLMAALRRSPFLLRSWALLGWVGARRLLSVLTPLARRDSPPAA